MDEASLKTELIEAYQTLDRSVQAAVAVSVSNVGIYVDGMTLRAYNILSRATVLGLSMLNICKIDNEKNDFLEILIDHVAIASVARTMMETCLLLSYCAEPDVSKEEKDLRYLIFRMHDTHARYIIFKEMSQFTANDDKKKAEKERDDFREGVDQIRRELKDNFMFSELSEEKQKNILAGKDMYIRGIRDVARRFERLKFFNYQYTYFSSFAHCSPFSFMRLEAQEISYEKPAGNQLNIATQAFYVSAEYLTACSDRIAELFAKRPPSA